MVTIGANVSPETIETIQNHFTGGKFQRLLGSKNLPLGENSVLIRLALINLDENFPTVDEITKWKPSLYRPDEFEDFWKKKSGMVKNVP